MQSTRNRDKYVKIHWENIISKFSHDFNAYNTTDDFGEPYDYKSVLHYSAKAFSKNGSPTIEALDKKFNGIIGQRAGLSEIDLRKLNKLYKCPAKQSYRLNRSKSFCKRNPHLPGCKVRSNGRKFRGFD